MHISCGFAGFSAAFLGEVQLIDGKLQVNDSFVAKAAVPAELQSLEDFSTEFIQAVVYCFWEIPS